MVHPGGPRASSGAKIRKTCGPHVLQGGERGETGKTTTTRSTTEKTETATTEMGQKQKGSEQELEAGDYGEDFAIIRDYLNDFSIEVKRAMKEINIRLNDLDGRGT